VYERHCEIFVRKAVWKRVHGDLDFNERIWCLTDTVEFHIHLLELRFQSRTVGNTEGYIGLFTC
jgi:hypothetical protein